MAYDSARGRVVLFGGVAVGNRLGDTWEWDGSTWIQRAPPVSPPARAGHAMAYDNIRSSTVLFSGDDINSQGLVDTWEWDGDMWVEKTPSAGPMSRTYSAMAFDIALGHVVLFGGCASSDCPAADTWEWDGSVWTQKTPPVSPPERQGPAMAYDSARGRVVLFGGVSGFNLADTWEYKLPETCNGIDDDYDSITPPNEIDHDGDGYVACGPWIGSVPNIVSGGDCNDTNPAIHPSAAEVCNGVDDNCEGQTDEGFDTDGDGFTTCNGDCNDLDAGDYSDAPQLCDGRNNNCSDPTWPTVPANEADADQDGIRVCSGDCNDANAAIHPGAIDDNCNALVDEDGDGEDTDTDGIHNACDNCPQVANVTQLDTDHDAVGNSCDNCALVANPAQQDADLDARGDACDNCRLDYNPLQDDYDGDRAGDACDNCLFDYNPPQTDLDDDVEGDLCDLDDGLIYILFHQPDYVEWQEETGYTTWNSYRGDLSVLRSGGPYTQLPGSQNLASRQCGLRDPWAPDPNDPMPGQAAFFLTTGVFGGESSLGTNSAGNPRPNANPCP